MTGRHAAEPATVERVFRGDRVLVVTSEAFADGCQRLAAAAARLGTISAVIGISNGGLAPASHIAHTLGARAYTVGAKHNATNGLYEQATGDVTCDLGPLIAQLQGDLLGGAVLLVDDIYGSGATMGTLIPQIGRHLAPGATLHTAVLCRNVANRDQPGGPDLWLWDTDDWTHFPWEDSLPAGTVTETLVVPSVARS
ncbi:hypothetical protein Lfu02_15440 [Longispora fulva]|uniref:Hypoxanthine phosphoribosyltransferase n=1 Tax=Longispora fulva TaxID=619741 RepID=A0A8J7GYC6_9ACTN|nr:phosphoribosyltransferase family protein [Longispora fulva]MBG6140446.1 hypoxanthine phosphoribosyltransferase [Longispora fulva]GIG57172.1 hypothetical protein Lfu02_15440 [Longispora fulva]